MFVLFLCRRIDNTGEVTIHGHYGGRSWVSRSSGWPSTAAVCLRWHGDETKQGGRDRRSVSQSYNRIKENATVLSSDVERAPQWWWWWWCAAPCKYLI
jgi:hypothetical protein